MMKILASLLILISFTTYSQEKVIISGTAFDSTNRGLSVHIVLNDTLRMFSNSSEWDEYQKLSMDTNFVVSTKADGKFRISAKKTDSLFFQSFRHIPQVYAIADLLKMKSINIRLEPQACIPYVRCNDTLPSNVYVFVGQKIKVDYEEEPYYCNRYLLDSRFKAEYKIVKQLAGSFPKDTIVFTVFDHYGTPPFSKYNNVLLFVNEYCNKLYHEKYQYFDLYKTTKGKWASPGDPYKYDEHHRKNIKAKKIKFADSVWFPIRGLHEAIIKRKFPAPYYKIEGQRAIPVMGTYLDDLVTIKKKGILKARNILMD